MRGVHELLHREITKNSLIHDYKWLDTHTVRDTD
jgi:hypothetical protein